MDTRRPVVPYAVAALLLGACSGGDLESLEPVESTTPTPATPSEAPSPEPEQTPEPEPSEEPSGDVLSPLGPTARFAAAAAERSVSPRLAVATTSATTSRWSVRRA